MESRSRMMFFYILVGLPGVGKSTFVTEFYNNVQMNDRNFSPDDFVVLSTDDIIENLGHMYNMNYNEMFDDVSYSFAEKIMHKVAKKKFEDKITYIIWDQTNLTVKSRKRKLDIVPKEYRKICVYIEAREDHQDRLDNRKDKIIPYKVIHSMKKNLVVPTKEEGFDEIVIL